MSAVRDRDGAPTAAADRASVATQWQLMWWRFRRHRLALVSAGVIAGLYVVVLGADFFAYSDPLASNAQRSLIPPQPIHLFGPGTVGPFVYAITGARDPNTFQRVYVQDLHTRLPVRLFVRGFPYRLFGVIPLDRHLIGVGGANAEDALFVLGTDVQGRDLWSRLMYGTRTSMTIGLVAVTLSLCLGVVLGGLSGFYPGVVDTVIQRVIEIIRSIPTIPLWMDSPPRCPRRGA